ncbi:MAG TPA: phosphoglycerate kinase [Candidatus Woesearchaeota archaeon]|nr:phosphoglycerate kinase [Candidatus Woesearchaeota archaeon]
MTVKSLSLKGRRVVLRADYNVPVLNGKVLDDERITASLDTLKYIISRGPRKITIISHLGRPKSFDKTLSLRPVAELLAKKLRKKVSFRALEDELASPSKSGLVLLENIRFFHEEKENSSSFSKSLASLGDVFVNDAFATMHRKHASNYGISKYIKPAIGLLVQKELSHLDLSKAKRPLVIIMGGSKLSTKLTFIKSFISKADKVLLGGAMIFTFYRALGFDVGKSLYEPDFVNSAAKLLKSEKIVLPSDVLVSRSLGAPVAIKYVDCKKIPKQHYGVDLGYRTLLDFVKIISDSKTVVWNGPLGIYEVEDFRVSSEDIALFLSALSSKTIVGGGDTAWLVRSMGLTRKFDFVSTGGGATLQFLANGTLPFLELARKR